MSLNNISSTALGSIHPGSEIIITGSGELLLPGDFLATLEEYRDAGRLSGVGLTIDLTKNAGFTTAYIPEPGSVMLLGGAMAGLLLCRRHA